MNVDCVGELVKLVFRHNHINRLNIYNQVGDLTDPLLTSDKIRVFETCYAQALHHCEIASCRSGFKSFFFILGLFLLFW